MTEESKPKIERFRFSLQVGNIQDNRFVTGASVTRDLVVDNEQAGAWDVLGQLILLLMAALQQALAEAMNRGWE